MKMEQARKGLYTGAADDECIKPGTAYIYK